MNSDLLKDLPAGIKLATEWHRDLGETFEEYVSEIFDEVVGYLHWPVTP